MELKSDANGIFIEGMKDSLELASYLQTKIQRRRHPKYIYEFDRRTYKYSAL